MKQSGQESSNACRNTQSSTVLLNIIHAGEPLEAVSSIGQWRGFFYLSQKRGLLCSVSQGAEREVPSAKKPAPPPPVPPYYIDCLLMDIDGCRPGLYIL